MCSWRRSLRLAWEVGRVLHLAAAERPQVGWVMLTLTVRNVSGEVLPRELDRVLKAWARLVRRKELAEVWGWFRTLEVTRSKKDGSWHPHIHALLAVSPSYWSRGYVAHKRWVELWAESMRLDYLPSVEVHRVKPRPSDEGRDALGKAAAEVAKYSVKDGDLLDGSQQELLDRVRVLHEALAGRRLYAWGGWLRELAARVGAPPEEVGSEDLVHVGEDHGPVCAVCGSELLEHVFRWLRSARRYVG